MKVGTRVKVISTGEVGIVVYSWEYKILQTTDNYIACFGYFFPENEPTEKPYILRYLDSSLEEITGENNG